MICKYLKTSERPSCLACERLMIPSIYDLQTFCQGTPEDCLVFQTKESSLDESRLKQKVDWSEAV